jgi:hypothetical protein
MKKKKILQTIHLRFNVEKRFRIGFDSDGESYDSIQDSADIPQQSFSRIRSSSKRKSEESEFEDDTPTKKPRLDNRSRSQGSDNNYTTFVIITFFFCFEA